MSNYVRVIPRDFFNEARLLKCLGRLELAILDGIDSVDNYIVSELKRPESGFIILQDTSDGSIFCTNYCVFKKLDGVEVYLRTSLNSKEQYPLIAGDGCVSVFDEDGKFTVEFREFLK